VKMLLFIALLPVATMVFGADAQSEVTDIGGAWRQPVTDDLVLYERGNMPVIVLAPHDGTVKPEGMPLRKLSTRDVLTAKLARLLCAELAYTDADGVQRRPHLVTCLASRAVVDPNLSWERNLEHGWYDGENRRASPPARAKRIHRDFHACVAYAVRSVEANHGAGLLLDLHGLSARRSVDMYGYEDNADAHLKRTILGREVVVAITDGKLDFGPWEAIFYGEFDGKRRKRVLVKIIGE